LNKGWDYTPSMPKKERVDVEMRENLAPGAYKNDLTMRPLKETHPFEKTNMKHLDCSDNSSTTVL